VIFYKHKKYNGFHSCPQCGAGSEWKGIRFLNRLIRVCCWGWCGTYEKAYSSLSDMRHFDGD